VSDQPSVSSTQLKRQLGLAALVFYGVGDILGAGIYALVGQIAGIAGRLSWLAFLIALVVASFTGLTYSELGSRFPRSGGESHFCQQAFRKRWLAQLIGWIVFCSGVVSLAATSVAFKGYLQSMVPALPSIAIVVAVLCTLAVLNFIGIHISSAANIVFTLIETSGLLLIVCLGLAYLVAGDAAVVPTGNPVPANQAIGLTALLQAAALAFFAFIGFEDLVNVAEECHNPRRDMPLAILLSAGIAGTLYVIVILVATRIVPPGQLSESEAPLMLVVAKAAPWFPHWVFTGIALFAVVNTGLLNFITASRLLYGMAQDRLLPSFLGSVHSKRQTPYWSILIVFVAAVGLATTGSLAYLAGTTSVLLLAVFATMNLALLRLKFKGDLPAGGFSVPVLVPAIGVIICCVLLANLPTRELNSAAILIIAGGLLAFLARRRQPTAAEHDERPNL
jgi:APA family basic amino acid/polyamine antiporter